MKYSLLLIAGVAAGLVLPIVKVQAGTEHSQETGVKIENILKVEKITWDDIVSEQLKRRDAQIAKAEAERLEAERLEAERQAQIEASKKAEEARLAQIAKQAPKVAQTAYIAARNMYTWGNCTWYVATRRAVPMWGNANQWLANARAAGWATGSEPRVGAIAWTGKGQYGHVAIVEAVNGNQITVSDMNYAGVGVVTTRLTSAGEWGGFIY